MLWTQGGGGGGGGTPTVETIEGWETNTLGDYGGNSGASDRSSSVFAVGSFSFYFNLGGNGRYVAEYNGAGTTVVQDKTYRTWHRVSNAGDTKVGTCYFGDGGATNGGNYTGYWAGLNAFDDQFELVYLNDPSGGSDGTPFATVANVMAADTWYELEFGVDSATNTHTLSVYDAGGTLIGTDSGVDATITTGVHGVWGRNSTGGAVRLYHDELREV